MKRENQSSAKIIFLAPVCLPASRHCYNSLKFQSLLNKHQEVQNWNKQEKYQATQILTCPNVQIFSVCSTTFLSQVEQCRLFNSLISCRQDNYQKNCHSGKISFNNFISCCRQDIFGNFISYKQKIFSCLHGDCWYIIFGKTMKALLTNLLVVKSVALLKKRL